MTRPPSRKDWTRSPFAELRNSQMAKDAVKMAFAAYKGLFGDAANAKLDQAKWGPFAKSLLQAMADGIKAGLPE